MKFVASGAEAPNLFSALGGTTKVVPFPRALGTLQGGQGHDGTQESD